MFRRRIAALAITATTVLASVLTISGPAAAAAPSIPIPDTTPAWIAQAENLGHAAGSTGVQARVYLAPNGGLDALKQAATAVSTPGSSNYGRFLSTAQYQQRFGPTSASVQKVSAYLRSTGLTVTGVAAGNRYVSVEGTVSAADRAFRTSIQRFQRDGQNVQAPATALSVPAAIASSVLAVTGLDTSPTRMTPATATDAPPPDGFRNARPCSVYFGQLDATYKADFKTPLPKFGGKTLPYAPCGYTGPQFRAAYEGNTALDGTGVTVAITDAYAAPTIKADANTYATSHGDGAYTAGQFTQTTAKKFTDEAACDPSGWYGEETLDVEAVHAMAPGAKIHYYGAASCNDADLLDTLAQVVADNTARIVTNSWSGLEQDETAGGVAAYETVFLQGALEGISFLFSSGDDGDELAATGIKQVDYPASDPYVTGVGGTSTAIDGNGKLAWQTGWGTDKYSLAANGKSWSPLGYLYGAGGGDSALFQQPAYQAGAAPGPARQVPDVAMDADPNTGMLIGETQTFPTGVAYGEYRIGGTSLASPLFAGMTALTLQKAGHGAGLLNPVIYKHRAGAFTDVKGAPKNAGDVRVDYANGLDASGGLLYSVRTFNMDSSLTVTRGWDNVTGVGSPNPAWFSALS